MQQANILLPAATLMNCLPEAIPPIFVTKICAPANPFTSPAMTRNIKHGSDYTPEKEWLRPIYTAYKCAFPLDEYQQNQSAYFTHTTRPEHTWDRTLDYLFTNHRWRAGSAITHQEFFNESDHAPVSAEFVLVKE